MNQIFVVRKKIQCSDGDMWSHWVDHDHRSYHKTEQGAKTAIAKYLAKEAENELASAELNPHLPKEHFEEEAKYILSNTGRFTDETNGDGYTDREIYDIAIIEIFE